MEEMENEFKLWIEIQMQSKTSSLMSKESYEKIKELILDKNNGKSINSYPEHIKKRVNRNDFRLINCPSFQLVNVLCVPKQEKSSKVSNVILFYLYFI